MTLGIRTGRERTRWICQGCERRIYVGEPSPTSLWPSKLNLTLEQVKLLLTAAAEFRDLSLKAGEPEAAVDFVDWLSVDALRDVSYHPAPFVEGTIPITRKPGTNRDPFPVPLQGNGERHTKGRRQTA